MSWIKCSEQLPEGPEPVLAAYREGDGWAVNVVGYTGLGWRDNLTAYGAGRYTHWHALPELPRD